MEQNRSMGKTRVLVEGALVVALTVLLSEWKIWKMPQGGSITRSPTAPSGWPGF